MHPLSARRFLLLVCMLLLCGCGREADNRVPVYPAHGKVTYQGKPAEGALVQLHSAEAEGQSLKPRARVGKDGVFQLTTYETGDGAPPGDYAVTIDWRRRNADDETEDGVSLISARYNRAETSNLRVRIVSSANELPEIRLGR